MPVRQVRELENEETYANLANEEWAGGRNPTPLLKGVKRHFGFVLKAEQIVFTHQSLRPGHVKDELPNRCNLLSVQQLLVRLERFNMATFANKRDRGGPGGPAK